MNNLGKKTQTLSRIMNHGERKVFNNSFVDIHEHRLINSRRYRKKVEKNRYKSEIK